MLDELKSEEVEKKLEDVINKYGASGKISVKEIKQKIFESDGDPMEATNRFKKWWFGAFPKRKINNLEIDEMQSLMQIFTDAWNVFPHRSLGGKSPQDKVREYNKDNPNGGLEEPAEDKMPGVTVRGMKMEFDDFQKMIKEMEEKQKPFKNWVDNTALPEYKKFLEQKFKTKKSIDKHYEVAQIFLERALFIGFLDFEQIRPEFAVWEFPEWWPTHVLGNDLNSVQVWSSLCDFFCFAEMVLKREIPGVWEESVGDNADDWNLNDVIIPPFASSESRSVPKTGRNEPCVCGSGKKFKKCCGIYGN
ncbi:MAG: SEC-C metal-binding domain-containing protein [Patescibacteria group bacterium]